MRDIEAGWSEPLPRRVLVTPLPLLCGISGDIVADVFALSRCVVWPGRGAVLESEALTLLFLDVLRVDGGIFLNYRQCIDAIALQPLAMTLARLHAVRQMPSDVAEQFRSTVAMSAMLRKRPWSPISAALRQVRHQLCEDKELYTSAGVKYRFSERGLRVFFGCYPEHLERLW